MKAQKILIIGGATIILAGVGVAGIASAQSGTNGDSIIDRIAERFHLNKSDVQQVFDQKRASSQAQRQKTYESRLDQAVQDGKLTSAQKKLILAKRQELATFLTTLSTMTPSDRRTALNAKMTDIRQWEKDNNIPPGFLTLFGGRGGRMHRGDGMGSGGGMSSDSI